MKTCKHFHWFVAAGTLLSAVLAFTSNAQNLNITNGLALWLAADRGVNTNVGGSVTAWLDLSGHSHSASQSNSTNQPSLLPQQLNGLPVIHFTAYQFLSLAGQIVSNQQFTIIVVTRDQETNETFRELFSNWNYPSPYTSSVFFGTTHTNPVRARLTDDFGGTAQGQVGVGTVDKPSDFSILTGVSGTNSVAVYQNISAIATRNTPLTTRIVTGQYVVGRQGTAVAPGTSEYWHGDIAEILVFNRELTGAELSQAWLYLQAKYFPINLAVGLVGNAIQLSFTTTTNQSYTLQHNDNLATTNWVNDTNFIGNGSLWQWLPSSVGQAQLFYRVREP
jgi:hypothetical protein